MKNLLVWTGTFFVHAAAQFFAWARADSPVLSTPGALALANALMFPTFWLAGALADRWFLITFVVNSVLWASAVTWAVRRFAFRRSRIKS